MIISQNVWNWIEIELKSTKFTKWANNEYAIVSLDGRNYAEVSTYVCVANKGDDTNCYFLIRWQQAKRNKQTQTRWKWQRLKTKKSNGAKFILELRAKCRNLVVLASLMTVREWADFTWINIKCNKFCCLVISFHFGDSRYRFIVLFNENVRFRV